MKSDINLSLFSFEAITIEVQETRSHQHRAQFFYEDLGNGIGLNLIFIPGETFLMGASETEVERRGGHPVGATLRPNREELPQHEVTVPSFFLSQHPITQAQWQAVAALPPIHRSLNPDSSYCKGAKRPVTTISWQEATEFCSRLSAHSGRQYRLPSEAEWEFACRAGTQTRFSWGDAEDATLANAIDYFLWASKKPSKSRKRTPRWRDRQTKEPWVPQTTVVDQFHPNAFGLYGLHGNVWEWCADSWHSGYYDAPTDGSVWEAEADVEQHPGLNEFFDSERSSSSLAGDPQLRVLRGGSCTVSLFDCRSASRVAIESDFKGWRSERSWMPIGFRIAWSSA